MRIKNNGAANVHLNLRNGHSIQIAAGATTEVLSDMYAPFVKPYEKDFNLTILEDSAPEVKPAPAKKAPVVEEPKAEPVKEDAQPEVPQPEAKEEVKEEPKAETAEEPKAEGRRSRKSRLS